MSLARSIVTFCIDISPSMGAKRRVTEEVDVSHATLSSYASPSTRERETTDLQWANGFVAKKVQSYILSGLKTAKVHILLYGSPRTSNTLLQTTGITEGYEGIDEIFNPAQPTIATLEVLRCLRAAREEEKPHKPDPLDALIAAITTLNNKDAGGSTNTWTRTIYLITNGKSPMNTDDKALIQNKLIEENITLKVIGIDFDDAEIGFKEEDKDPIQAKNEEWWHDFLDSLPSSGIATAAHVIAQSSLPSIHLQTSAPSATTLIFGNPAEQHTDDSVMGVPIKLYKATAVARPLSQKKLSKIAQESAAAQSQTARMSQEFSQYRPSSTPHMPKRDLSQNGVSYGEGGLTYGVQMQKRYFIKDDLEMVEGGIDAAEPLPEGAEDTFDKAYKLGATLVAVNEDLEAPMDTKAGMEIIQFTNKKLYQRQYHLGETWYLFASDGNYKAQIQLSSLIQAMSEQDKYAIVRYVRRDGSEPKLGILAPILKDEMDSVPCECMSYVEVPFSEDLKRFTFPPLDRVINREGKELLEHTSLPSKEMQSCMDDMVDSMDLMDAEQDGDEEQPRPWFSCIESFNPAIHATKEAVSWRVFHPEDKALPLPHREVLKFLKTPETAERRSDGLGKRCREVFDLNSYFPIDKKKAGKRQAEERARERGDPDLLDNGERKELNLEGVMDEELAAEQSQRKEVTNAVAADKASQDNASDTEDEGEEIISITRSSNGEIKQETDSGSVPPSKTSTDTLDTSDPIADFERKLADAKYPVEATVDAMGAAITSKIMKSFASNGYSDARDMIRAMRKGAIEYEEAERYNTFLRELKSQVLDESLPRSRADFWNTRMQGREELSLITDEEYVGEHLGIDKEASVEFINL